MEVILKKTKITSSIIKQSTGASELDLTPSNVLGWCNYSSGKFRYKYILLYRSATQDLKVYLYFDEFKDEDINDYKHRDGDYSPAKYNLEVIRKGYTSKYYTFTTEEERTKFKENLKLVKHQAQMRGQIYL